MRNFSKKKISSRSALISLTWKTRPFCCFFFIYFNSSSWKIRNFYLFLVNIRNVILKILWRNFFFYFIYFTCTRGSFNSQVLWLSIKFLLKYQTGLKKKLNTRKKWSGVVVCVCDRWSAIFAYKIYISFKVEHFFFLIQFFCKRFWSEFNFLFI